MTLTSKPFARAMAGADRVDPDALQRFIISKQRQPLKPGEGVKPQYLCIAKHPKHTTPAPFKKPRGCLNFMWKHYIKRILLLSIRLLILKGLWTGNLAGQGELLNISSGFCINNGALYPFEQPWMKDHHTMLFHNFRLKTPISLVM